MKYKLTVRVFTENDANASCPFAPDQDEVNARFAALIAEIQELSQVKRTETNGFEVVIELAEAVSSQELKKLMRPAFSQLWCFLRLVSLVPLETQRT